MNKYRVRVVYVPTKLRRILFGEITERKWRTIRGYTLEHAKRRAGIT